MANQKAKYLVKKLNKIVKDQKHTKPFEFHNQGSLAYIGNWLVLRHLIYSVHDSMGRHRRAIYDRSNAESIQTKESGRFAWLLWRSAYFTMTLSLRNKILVPTYWFMNCTWLSPLINSPDSPRKGFSVETSLVFRAASACAP